MTNSPMPDNESDFTDLSHQRQRQAALARWESEGGAGPWGLAKHVVSAAASFADSPPLTNTELVQLQIRVIALENLVIALLAEGSDRQLALAREMAEYISPRPGFTHHRLTIHAAAEMVSLVRRAGAFR